MITYFSWWYGQGLGKFFDAITIMTKKIFLSFSIPILIRTLFDPWKRDVVYAQNASLQVQFQILIGNLVARLVGFTVRFFTILTGLLMSGLFFMVLFICFIIWLSLPVIIIFLIINGIRTITNG